MSHIFISHATADDDFVTELRRRLEGLGIPIWVDSRNLRGGDRLDAEIRGAIATADHCIVVLSPRTVNSPWVRKEIAHALAVQDAWDEYRVIPLLLPGIKPSALALWFDEEPLGVRVDLDPGDLDIALPRILAALGKELPTDIQPMVVVPPEQVDELILELRDPVIVDQDGAQRARATATLVYQPADPAARAIESRRYTLTAPLGPIEQEEIRWYLEEYSLWPIGVFRARAEHTEQALPGWGQVLYTAALGSESAREALVTWKQGRGAARRFSLWVDREPPEGASAEKQAETHRAATELLALPWELLHDGAGFLLHGGNPVRVRRRLPNRQQQTITPARAPIRILLLSPRPEVLVRNGQRMPVGYIDHRSSALPLVQAVENLGDLAHLTVLHPPTLPALQRELQRARDAGSPYHVVHFDGHGVYDRRAGLGALLFEDPQDRETLGKRRGELVHADRMAAVMRDHGIPLVFLDACQTSQAEEELSSVATCLLEQGVSSVVAMSYSVLVETSRRFVEAFYATLALGQPVGRAMLAGQQTLEGERFRLKVMGAGELHLADWFVPVLYQDAADPPLFTRLPPAAVQQLHSQQRRLRLGQLPATPPHTFVGRSRELLRLERLLLLEHYAVVRGTGGAGKTALAVEAARWLVRSGRFRRSAFVSLEEWQDERAVLDALGRQLLPDGDRYSVAQYPSLGQALQPVVRTLRDDPTVIVIDNVESVLAWAWEFTAKDVKSAKEKASTGEAVEAGEEGANGESTEVEESAPDPAVHSSASAVAKIFDLCRRLLSADPATRLIFTSRERLPAPFDRDRCNVELGALSPQDAVRLVERVMADEGWQPAAADSGRTSQEVQDLVDAVDRHARALVLLAREVAHWGVTVTTERLYELMAELDRRNPGDRENSLYASVELSLQRLPADVRERVNALGVVHGGGRLEMLAHVMNVDVEMARAIGASLIEVGLADELPYLYLRLDSALAPYLAGRLDAEVIAALRTRWAEVMMALVDFLYHQKLQDTQLQEQLTLLEMPNLTALLDWLAEQMEAEQVGPERVVDVAGAIEKLLEDLSRPAALVRAVQVREGAAKRLGDWSPAQFVAEMLSVERWLQQGSYQAALQAAETLRRRTLAAGENAYEHATYHIALSHSLLGRVLQKIGHAADALVLLQEGEAIFQVLANGGDNMAAHMVAAVLLNQGDCLRDLGRLDQAAVVYQEIIERLPKSDKRHVAAVKGQLGTVRLLQGRSTDALAAWDEARYIFQELGELTSVASAWHQIGKIHHKEGQWIEAERAYRQALAIDVQQHDWFDQALDLTALGLLYDSMGRLEEAVSFYRQATEIYVVQGDQYYEGITRSNAAITLVKLGRLDEARREVERAIECKHPFGHAAELWKSWDILHDIETAAGNPSAAQEAWRRSRNAYLAYRRDGGGAHEQFARLIALFERDLSQRQTAELRTMLTDLLTDLQSSGQLPQRNRILVEHLIALLDGARDPNIADNTELPSTGAAELLLLLERLGSGDTET